ncbi:MAG: pyridoxal 5'-phosphate synthase glutaminase subunit PdxT [Acidimicrobiia bacterium]
MVATGVLALQGDFREHLNMLRRVGTEPIPIRTPAQLEQIEALVIPGGESTTIGKLADRFGLIGPLRERIASGMPVYGTCAGMIFLSSAVTEGEQHLLGVLDAVVHRNAFGRQNESFEDDLDIVGFDSPFRAVFIRAPWLAKLGDEVEVLATIDDHPVMVRQGSILATSFHPELTDDPRIHRLLVDLI